MLFRRKSKDTLLNKELTQVTVKKSRSARDLLLRLTTTPLQSKKSLENHNDFETNQLKLHLDTNRQYLPYEEPFNVMTPKENEFKDRDLMTPIRQMTTTPETMQAPQQDPSRTHPPEERAKVLSTIIDFENESIIEMYTPRKPVYIQNQVRLDSACAIFEKISLLDDKESRESEQYDVVEEEEEDILGDQFDDELTFDGTFSTSTSRQNSPSRDPFDSVSLTETNIQIYKRLHRKSKHSSLHFVQGAIESPTKPQRKQITPTNSLQAGLVEEEEHESKNADLYQLEMMLMEEKHKYEMKQQQRAMDQLRLQLKQQRTENTVLRNQLAQLEYEGSLLPAFKWDKPVTKKNGVKSPKVSFKDYDDDTGSVISTEESIMSLYYDERKVSGASTVGSSTNSVNKNYD